MKAIQIAYDQNFKKTCKYVAEAGFRYVALDFTVLSDPSDAIYDKTPDHIMAILENHQLKAVQTHLYNYHPAHSADKIDPQHEHRVLREIEVSGKIGAHWCVWHPRYYFSGEWKTGKYDEEKTMYYNQQTLPIYAEQARHFHTGIALENLWGHMIRGGIPMLARLCDSVHAENVGICWDTGHANIMEHEQAQDEAIRFLGKRIKCTHIHNNFKNYMDLHQPPDTGNIDWNKVMKAFLEIGYAGPFTLETRCLYPQDDQLFRDFICYNFKCLEFLHRRSNVCR